MVSVEQLWSEKFAPLAAAAEAEQDDRRAEDFIDLPIAICGFPLRALTPRDLLILNYGGNAFIAGGEIEITTIAQILLALHADPPRRAENRKQFFDACNALDYDTAVADIRRYLDRIFADQPKAYGPAEKVRPIGTSFVAPLIVRIASGIPSLTPQAIMDTPLPQLFQYQKILDAERAAKSGSRFRDPSPTDMFLAQCLEEANRINAAPEVTPAA